MTGTRPARAGVGFLIATGTRRGEALGLRWSDVDLDTATVTIRRQRVVVGGRVVEGAP